MSTFKIHDIDSAPKNSQPFLEKSLQNFGMIPNLHGVLAEAPGALEAYQTLHQLFENSSLNNEELTVVWLTISVANECHYCVPAHTAIAHMMKVDPLITEALRNGTSMPTPKLHALHTMTLSIVQNRGQITKEELMDFYAAGYEKRQLLEIILGVSQKIMSNYLNHIAETPVDAPFQKYAWKK
ncbi:carboxymuconolactone decarboxylase family protein [Arenibacter sp. 6A1]|uniref:carboxymuconolactone decarboxylase family protein n=1 Tax=Arenibacter sp. 6A1 TaxID=2720391 RepID=UPI00144562D1|nr:carboxymuconolactone decarboxylase family protein [Arenibacter sp. 6A1]NKI26974.1 carboxymuconolactone decarboxylase family protein [Arenibacter sp. 6A1]